MEKLKKVFEKDEFAKYVGVELLEVGEGRAKARMEVKPHHFNSIGIVQGGAIFTLADFAFAAASNSRGNVAVAINANISYVKAVKEGVLIAEAEEISLNPKLATYTIYVKDEEGEVVAIFQGMVYRKKESLPVP